MPARAHRNRQVETAMPSLPFGRTAGRAAGRSTGIMGRLALFNQLISIVRELRVDDVRKDAEMRPVLLVVAPDRATAADLGHRLVGWSEDRAVSAKTFDDTMGDLNRFDLIVAYDPDEVGRVATLRTKAERLGTLATIVRHDAAALDDDAALEATRRRIVEVLPERAVAFGRAFPPFRAAALSAVVRTTARANAQFALIANIPSVIPIVGSLFSAGADLFVLTKNQVLLLFKVAAIHGRDLRDTSGILREIVPVVGSGLLWRTLAREAVSFLPLLAGTIPKVAIAYAGTFAVGRAADYYYRFGYAPTRAQRREFYAQGHDDLHEASSDIVARARAARPDRSSDGTTVTEVTDATSVTDVTPTPVAAAPSGDAEATRVAGAGSFTDETATASTEPVGTSREDQRT